MKVFISYSSKNHLRALRLAQKLLEHGVQVWYDEWDMLVGQSILDSIYDGIRGCDYLAVMLTKHSCKSRWVREELNYAKQEELRSNGVKILPLLYEKCAIPDSLRDKHYADFTNFDKGFASLLKVIGIEAAETSLADTAPSLSDKDIKCLFADLNSENHERALNAAKVLSAFRDPEAKKVLLRKLEGTAYERNVAVTGLVSYNTDELVGPILCALPTDILASLAAEEHGESQLMVDTIRHAVRFLRNFPAGMPLLYLAGAYIVSTLKSHELPNKVASVVRAESLQGLRAIDRNQLVSSFVRLFGFSNIKDGLQRLVLAVPEKDSRFLTQLVRAAESQKAMGMAIPEAPKLFERFRLSGIEEGWYHSFDSDEFKMLRDAYDKYFARARKDAEPELKMLGSVLQAAKEVYGFYPDDEESTQNERILSKLQLFLRLRQRQEDPVTEGELEEWQADKKKACLEKVQRLASDLFEHTRTRFPVAAIEFMMERA